MEARGPAIMMPRTTMRVEGMISEPPFRGDLDHAALTLEPQDDVGGVRCDVVVLARGTGGRRQRWYIGADDGIPRRAVEVTSGTMGGELDITLTNLHVDVGDPPAMAQGDLHVPLPDGYTEDRVKGPAKPAPAPPHTAGSPTPPGAIATPEPPKPVPPAPPPPVIFPDAELDQAGGGKVNFADLRGGVYVVDFFGSWCIPAPAWHVHYNSLAARFAPTGVRFFGVGVRERDNANLLNDTREPKREFTLLLGGDAVARRLDLRVYPATVVVDKEGRVVEIVQGARGEDSAKAVSDAIQNALGIAPTGAKAETKDAEKPIDQPAEPRPDRPANDAKPEEMPK
jgi:thiol-disulfide isomerase/thioredoxin